MNELEPWKRLQLSTSYPEHQPGPKSEQPHNQVGTQTKTGNNPKSTKLRTRNNTLKLESPTICIHQYMKCISRNHNKHLHYY